MAPHRALLPIAGLAAALLAACGGSGGDTPGGGRGGFSDYWRRTSSDVTVLDPAHPLSQTTTTVALPKGLPVPEDDRKLELIQQIEDDTLYTYAHFDGDEVYYRLAQPLIKVDDSYGLIGADGMHSYSLSDGRLTDTSTLQVGTLMAYGEATYTKLEGEFPPAGWPTVSVDALLPDAP